MVSNSKKIFFIVGERSGDLHAGNLIKSLKQKDASLNIIGWGGNYMEQNGCTLLKHYRDLAFMGILEVLKNIFTIKEILKTCKEQLLEQKPSMVVLVDYGGFNMKIAKFCKENKIPVHYYISPKVWAWNTKRAYKIKEYVDYLYCILPFEPKFFKQFDYETTYVGNPVVDAITDFKLNENTSFPSEKPLVAVLPGSRKQEVEKMLSLMVEIVPYFKEYNFVVTGVDNLDEQLYQAAKDAGIQVVYNQTYAVLNNAKAALVTSGTATLETAMFGVPQAVCYRTSNFTYFIAKSVIKVPFISLVNLIGDKEVVKELIQEQFSLETVKNELFNLLESPERINQIKTDYQEVARILGDKNASNTVASLILERV